MAECGLCGKGADVIRDGGDVEGDWRGVGESAAPVCVRGAACGRRRVWRPVCLTDCPNGGIGHHAGRPPIEEAQSVAKERIGAMFRIC